MRFDTCAHTYDAHAAPQKAFAARVAAFLQGRSAGSVVEFGAGTGALTRHLCSQPGIEVHATDVSPTMVDLGRAAVPQARWSVLDAFRGDLPKADLQVSSGLLQWAEDPVRVLMRWREALSEGGRMVHAFPCDPCLVEWRALVQESPLQWRDEAAWRRVFDGAGLLVTRRELWVDRHVFPSTLDMVRAMHRSGVTGRTRLNAGRLRGAIRSYELKHRRPKGVVATWAWLAIEAVPQR
ncbi:MAG TPA: methyltransferase [Clostridia bacterium]|nr:methyltransferase [Clostridia bacterium]